MALANRPHQDCLLDLCCPAALHLQALRTHSARAATLGICWAPTAAVSSTTACVALCVVSRTASSALGSAPAGLSGSGPALTQGAAAPGAATSAATALCLVPSRCQPLLTPAPLLERLQDRRLKAPHPALPHGRRLQMRCWQRVHPAPPPDTVHLLLQSLSTPPAQLQPPT